MPEIKKVFLSSTARDLPEYRDAVYEAVQELDDYKCVRMEDFGAHAASPIEQCRRAVGECDLFVGVIGPLHGSSPPGSESSFTELEYYAAVDYKKPRLMFVTPKGFGGREDLPEDDDKRARQARFRKLVLESNVAETDFDTPERLARAVVTAVFKWEREAVTERKKSAPNPSANVPRTCDREDQEADFVRYLRLSETYRSCLPLVCVVRGEEGQNHWSFVRRICNTRIQVAAVRYGGKDATVKPCKDVAWPYADDLRSRRESLIYWLFEALAPEDDSRERKADYSAASLRALLDESLSSVVVLQHEVRAEHWDRTTAALLREYLSFWDEVGAGAAHTRCIVFLNVVYPEARREGLWSLWRKLRRANPLGLNKRVERGLRAVCEQPERAIEPGRAKDPARSLAAAPSHCAFAMLDELTCVEKKHVTKWLRDNLFSDDEAEIEKNALRILTDERGRLSKCRNMREVESKLNRIHARIVSETA